jgi:hypothetical protein
VYQQLYKWGIQYKQYFRKKHYDCRNKEETLHDKDGGGFRNLHIVMIGDSLMRYQYMSLVYRLRHGIWFDSSKWHYDISYVPTFDDGFHPKSSMWEEFYFHSSQLLQPYEICDCYRRRSPLMKASLTDRPIENRYYYDPTNNNSVVFLQILDQIWFQGRILPYNTNGTMNDKQKRQVFEGYRSFSSMPIVWSYTNWADLIRNHLPMLQPQPEYVVLNSGRHPHRFGLNDGVLSKETTQLVKAMNEMTQYKYAWRTTTYDVEHNGKSTQADMVMCEQLQYCINVAFTRDVQQKYYWDFSHFKEPVYRIINEAMLDVLGYLPSSNYARLNMSVVTQS